MDISLIETLRFEPEEGFIRLDRHLARLQRSAAALGILGAERAEAALSDAVGATPFPPPRGEGGPEGREGSSQQSPATSLQPPLPNPSPQRGGACPLRVRLELFADGRIEVKTARFVPLAADAVWTVRIATTRLSSAEPLLRHKTSRRAVYEAARAEFSAADADEVILLNERGEVCEGTITSVFLDDGTGILKTPPLDCGLLAGVLREELLATGRATEQRLQVDDLLRHPFFVGNSLRGLIPARLAG
ncbi:aminotransferase class IV family protein [Mycoplana dimorpha]|uniref:Probable branched-chain-amino-acid aminotransferase n=1 Tax=Mycoplana dimorpha TaxID=28320 RepID=A0A2T5B5U3_MYCDI|nr:aminotransferase class IV family protein [Mycoplana dimorpha]PTM94355.1 4-amino-4-deoxychorismate lyase [Mycoplana dimorpha]